MRKIVVPDASVILKWAFDNPDENHRDKSVMLLETWLTGEIEITLPKLWCFEVGNVLMLKTPELAPKFMKLFLEYNFTESEMTVELSDITLGIMKNHRVTFYDAAYHATALLNNGLLVTADESYYNKTRAIGNISALSNWEESLKE